MARIARVVAPGHPHHITQRGNRRQKTFFQPSDYELYLDLWAEYAPQAGLRVWSYCLMPNHVHLIVVPQAPDSLARGIGEIHRRYTREIHFRKRWRGYLWQGRFGSYVMDEPYCLTATRYVLRNPVEAKLTKTAAAWRWSSAQAHLGRREVPLLDPKSPLDALIADWPAFLAERQPAGTRRALEEHLRTGRPQGGEGFVTRLEKKLGRELQPRKRGPKPRAGS